VTRRGNPAWDRSWIRGIWLGREPAAQPIADVGDSDRILPISTGLLCLIFADTTRIRPEKRGTNSSVRTKNRPLPP
jgi:hypothetical protein